MKITADTNVLVRAIMGDNERQSRVAQAELMKAAVVALALPALCELVRVLSQSYKIPPGEIAEAIRRLMNGANVVMNRPAAEAGLALLNAGGDFADGVIAYEGSWLGADTFISFDKKAVKLMKARGGSVRLLSEHPPSIATPYVLVNRTALLRPLPSKFASVFRPAEWMPWAASSSSRSSVSPGREPSLAGSRRLRRPARVPCRR